MCTASSSTRSKPFFGSMFHSPYHKILSRPDKSDYWEWKQWMCRIGKRFTEGSLLFFNEFNFNVLQVIQSLYKEHNLKIRAWISFSGWSSFAKREIRMGWCWQIFEIRLSNRSNRYGSWQQRSWKQRLHRGWWKLETSWGLQTDQKMYWTRREKVR